MRLHTQNSIYTLEDRGDGAFEITSTNTKYPGPYLVEALEPPTVGTRGVFKWLRNYGFKPLFVTSLILRIEPS